MRVLFIGGPLAGTTAELPEAPDHLVAEPSLAALAGSPGAARTPLGPGRLMPCLELAEISALTGRSYHDTTVLYHRRILISDDFTPVCVYIADGTPRREALEAFARWSASNNGQQEDAGREPLA